MSEIGSYINIVCSIAIASDWIQNEAFFTPLFCENVWMYTLVNVELLKWIIITREFGVVVKVSNFRSPALDGSVGGSGPVGPQIFFLEKKSKKKKKSRVTSLPSPFPQRVAGFSPVGRQPRIRNGIKEKNHFCGLEPSNPAAAYDQPRKLYASARDSAMVSTSDR